MRSGPCAFDPSASAQPHGPNSLMPIQRTPQPLPQPLSPSTHTPWVEYGSCTRALMGTCSISKPGQLELYGEGHSLAPLSFCYNSIVSLSGMEKKKITFCLYYAFVHRMVVCSSTTPQHWLSTSVSLCGPTRHWSVWCHWERAASKASGKPAPPPPA